MSIYKYYEAVSKEYGTQLELTPTQYIVYAVGEDLMEASKNVISYLHTLNKHFPERYCFTPYIHNGGTCVRYYKSHSSPKVDLTIGFYAAEPTGPTDSHWMHNCMQN